MKKIPRFSCVLLAVSLTAQTALAETVTVNNVQAMGANMKWIVTGALTPEGDTRVYSPGTVTYNNNRPSLRNNVNPGAEAGGKAWIQFDLSSIWATHGQSNLLSATITLWNANGTSRKFDVAGLADNSGLEGWTQETLTWDNAPGNDITSSYAFTPSVLYNGEVLWPSRNEGINVEGEAPYNQSAKYISPDISAFLLTDTDGKVTFMISGSDTPNNQSMWIGVGGTYPVDHPNVSSPTLTLEFASVPEPGTVALCLLGLGFLCLGQTRRAASRRGA